MKNRTTILLSILTVVTVVYVSLIPEIIPAPTEAEIAEIAKKIEWSGQGNTTDGKLPIIEFPKNNPFIRLVRVFTTEYENGYTFKENYLTIDFGHDN